MTADSTYYNQLTTHKRIETSLIGIIVCRAALTDMGFDLVNHIAEKEGQAHISQVQGEWGSSPQAKQKRSPQEHSGSQCTSPSTLIARPQ